MAHSRRQALQTFGALGAGAWIAPAILSVDAAAASSACALCGSELVANPSAEHYTPNVAGNAQYDPNVPGTGTAPGATPDGWTTTNGFRVITYGSVDYPATAPPVPPPASQDVMFSGPLDAGAATPSTARQSVSLAACAAVIDLGTLPFTLSAYLGGASVYPDTMQLDAAFRDVSANTISTVTLGPALATGGFTLHTLSGLVPALTRSVVFTLTATKAAAPVHSRSTGAADLVSFQLC